VNFTDAAAPTLTITGTVHPGTAPGTLVQNLVGVTSAGRAADQTNDVVSNAYLIALGPAPTLDPSPAASTRVTSPQSGHANPLLAVGAVLALGCLGLAGLIVGRQHRRS
jgi:hypothetical protein